LNPLFTKGANFKIRTFQPDQHFNFESSSNFSGDQDARLRRLPLSGNFLTFSLSFLSYLTQNLTH
jgi:hypothetical protein